MLRAAVCKKVGTGAAAGWPPVCQAPLGLGAHRDPAVGCLSHCSVLLYNSHDDLYSTESTAQGEKKCTESNSQGEKKRK